MTTLYSASNYRVWRSARLGALGFGFGFALAWSVVAAAGRQSHDDFAFRLLGTVAFAGAGALGGVALAWGHESKHRAALLALAGALGCGLGWFVTATIVSAWIDEPGSPVNGFVAWEVVDTLQFAAIGALTGALLSLAPRDRRRTARLLLAGLLGFGLFFLSHNFVDRLSTLVPGTRGEIWRDGIVMALGPLLWGGVGGAIGGACLGIGDAWRPRPKAPAGISGAAGVGV
jgi:hypothetical protein